MPAAPRSPVQKVGRVLRGIALGLAAVLIFAVALVVGVIAHLGTAPARRLVATQLPALLEGTIPGRVAVQAIGALSIGGVGRVDAELFHRDGGRVAILRGVTVELDTVELVKSLIGDGPVVVPIEEVSIDAVDVDVSAHAGSFRVVEAFVDPDAPTPPEDPQAKGLVLRVEELAIRHVWAHGIVEPGGGAAPIFADADIDDLLVRLSVTPERITAAIENLDLTTRSAPLGADIRARLHAVLTLRGESVTETPPMAASFAINGTVAGMPLSALGFLWGDDLHAFVAAHQVTPDQIRTLVPEAPLLGASAAVVAFADGTLQHLTGKVLLLAGASRIDLSADVVLEPAIVVKAHVDATSLDASLVGGPKSALSLVVDAEIKAPADGDPSGEIQLTTEPGAVAGFIVPSIVASGTFHGQHAQGEADIHEPGMLTHLAVTAAPAAAGGPQGMIVDAKLDAPRVELAKLQGRGVDARGVLSVTAEGRVDLAAQRMAARANVRGLALSSPMAVDATIGSLTADLRATGALTEPQVDAQVDARTVRVAGKRIDWLRVGASGSAKHPVIIAEMMSVDLPRVKARTQLHVEPTLAVTSTVVDASRGTTTAHVEVARVDLGAPGFPEIRDLTVDGLGDRLTASASPAPRGGLHVVARSTRISLPAVQQLAALDVGVSRGDIALDADLAVDSRNIDGKLALDVDDVVATRDGLHVDGLDASVRAAFDGRRVTFDVAAGTEKLGHLEVTTRRPLDLAGPPTEVSSWVKATGQVAIDGDFDLGAASRLVPDEMLPVADVSGRLVITGHADRNGQRAVTCALAARTDRLALTTKPPPPPANGGASKPFRVDPNPANATLTAAKERTEGRTDRAVGPVKPTTLRSGCGGATLSQGRPDPTPAGARTLRGVDLSLHFACENEPEEHVTVTAAARDATGPFVTLDLAAQLPYGRLLERGVGDGQWLEETPFTLHVAIPSRTIESLPPSLGIPRAKGRVVAELTAEGTPRRPVLQLDAALAGMSIEKSPLEQPFSAKVVARYDGATAVAHVAIDQSTTRLLKGMAEAKVAIADLLRPQAGNPLPWTASADVEMGPMPLDILQAVLPAKIEGLAHGRIKLERLHENASLAAFVNVDKLVVGGIPHEMARLEVTVKDGLLDGALRLVQARGSLEADAKVGVDWGARIAPEMKADRKFDVGLRAKSFRLRAVEPFVTSSLHQLDGRLDGEVRLSQAAIQEALQSGGAKGKLVLSSGKVELAAAGGQLEDVRATLRIDERGILRIEDVFARGQTGQLHAAGLVTFGGEGFFQAARLNVVIPARKPMPLLVAGEHLGDVSGDIRVGANWRDQGKELRVDVDVPKLVVTLPDRMPDGVQKLDEIERACIGTIRKGRFVPLPLDAPDPVVEATPSAFRTRLDIHLRDTSIEMGDILRTRLTGNPTLMLEDGQTVMAGSITIRGGRVDIKGRLFNIDRGTITFGADPANPDVLLTASWGAPDGTKVYADFAGPVQTGKVTLRSNPPRSRDEIIALVVFGRVEGYQPGGEQADAATQAVGAAGGFATQGLNKALDDVTSLEIRTRVDTSSSTNPKPELEVQISQEVAVKIAYILGELAPGQAADKTFATVDWNFKPDWSLETTVGDKASTTVDMIWEHVY